MGHSAEPPKLQVPIEIVCAGAVYGGEEPCLLHTGLQDIMSLLTHTTSDELPLGWWDSERIVGEDSERG
jgi:hypothetical protein